MPNRPFARALVYGAGAALLILLVVLAIRYFNPQREERREVANAFNPAAWSAPPRLDAPYVVSDTQVVDAMLSLARLRPDDYVIDLGSGDGRILIAAARSNGARGLGVDIDPARIEEANRNARAAGVTGLVSFRRQDLFETPLQEADILTLYLTPEVNLRLRPRILSQMRPGTRVVSHDYDMGEWRYDQRRRVGRSNVFLWTVPARVDGRWTLTDNGRAVPLSISQEFQRFTGTVNEDGRIEQGRLNGTAIRFIANLGRGRQVYEGIVEGDRMTGTGSGASWSAVRAQS
ncbi:MAG TPA: methyltransferase domain-containing protein [Allosphingosinicella sp.]|nr:methyltransferase domain-containing protein [Allosphingosinicella sp.]